MTETGRMSAPSRAFIRQVFPRLNCPTTTRLNVLVSSLSFDLQAGIPVREAQVEHLFYDFEDTLPAVFEITDSVPRAGNRSRNARHKISGQKTPSGRMNGQERRIFDKLRGKGAIERGLH